MGNIPPPVENVVDLTQHAPLIDALLNAYREMDRWEGVFQILKKQVQAIMGDATHATCDGKEVLTWKQVGKFSVGAFKDAHPDLYAKYLRQFTVTELDKDAIQEELPELYGQFRGRVFNRLVK